MAKIAKTADRKKVMDTTKSTDCPKCGKPTRVVKRVKDRERTFPAACTSRARRASFTKSCKAPAASNGLVVSQERGPAALLSCAAETAHSSRITSVISASVSSTTCRFHSSSHAPRLVM